MLKNKLIRKTVSIVILLMLSGINIIPLTVGKTIEKHDIDLVETVLTETNFEEQLTTQEKPLWGLGLLYVHVEEVYGSPFDPEYKDLPEVDVSAFGLFYPWARYHILSNENGKCLMYAIHPGLYLVKASKDGYKDISSGFKKFRLRWITPAEIDSIHFTLAKKNGTNTKNSQINTLKYNIKSATPVLENLNPEKELTTGIYMVDNHPDFPPEFLVIIGRYISVESDQIGFRQSLIVHCNLGKILVFGIKWAKASQYGSWVWSPFICAKITYIEAPSFYGFYHNSRICGVTFGNWDINRRE